MVFVIVKEKGETSKNATELETVLKHAEEISRSF
jgi:hypothetical protein